MTISEDNRTHLRQCLMHMKAEIALIQQSLETAPQKMKDNHYYGDAGKLDGYVLDEYLLGFRLGNVMDMSMHTFDLLKIVKGGK